MKISFTTAEISLIECAALNGKITYKIEVNKFNGKIYTTTHTFDADYVIHGFIGNQTPQLHIIKNHHIYQLSTPETSIIIHPDKYHAHILDIVYSYRLYLDREASLKIMRDRLFNLDKTYRERMRALKSLGEIPYSFNVQN